MADAEIVRWVGQSNRSLAMNATATKPIAAAAVGPHIAGGRKASNFT